MPKVFEWRGLVESDKYGNEIIYPVKCTGQPRLGLEEHYTDISYFYNKGVKDKRPRKICYGCATIEASHYNVSDTKKKHNDSRYGPNANPKARATYSKCGIRNRAMRKAARPEWVDTCPIARAIEESILLYRDSLNSIMGKRTYDLHHYKPLAAGGLDEPDNWIVITSKLNQQIGSSWDKSQQHLSHFFR